MPSVSDLRFVAAENTVTENQERGRYRPLLHFHAESGLGYGIGSPDVDYALLYPSGAEGIEQERLRSHKVPVE
jgi:hypothetical protein